jgi:hypothetical protein
MTVPTGTIVSTSSNIGIREDLEDVIYRVAPEQTPFMSNIGKVTAKQQYHEWQTETLASASVTASIILEGDTFATAAGNLTTRVGNMCQVMAKAGSVSRTQSKTNLAGRTSELARQKILKSLELKRDFEFRIIGNNAAVAESGATTRKTGGALAWITTNDSRGAGAGADGGFSASPGPAAATNGTQRTFTETLLKTVLATTFNSGGMPSQAYLGATHKQQASAFTGIADIRVDGGKTAATTRIVGAADVYVSDFGAITFIPHAYGLTRDCLIIDPEMWAVATLDGMHSEELAKTADATSSPSCSRRAWSAATRSPRRSSPTSSDRSSSPQGRRLRGPPLFPGEPMPTVSTAQAAAEKALAIAKAVAEASEAPDAEKVAKAQAQKERADQQRLERALEKAETDAEKDAIRRVLAERHRDVVVSDELVTCRVLPMGDGKISTGEHIGGVGDLYYERGETFTVARSIAEPLERRGLAEIQGAPAPAKASD